jgi:hypothetical protein
LLDDWNENLEATYDWLKQQEPNGPVISEQAQMRRHTDAYAKMYAPIGDIERYAKRKLDTTRPVMQALYYMTMFSKQRTKGQAWHQDCPPDEPQKFNLNSLVYTMDINHQVGGEVLVMPGSHRQGKILLRFYLYKTALQRQQNNKTKYSHIVQTIILNF